MDRSKVVAILTGAIALLLGLAYLVMVQLLDMRGEMIPAPISLAPTFPALPAVLHRFVVGFPL
jgi:hypothetical protein